MGVASVLGVALLCAINGATVENNLFEDGDGTNTFHAFNPTQAEETYSVFMDECSWSSLALNLRAYDFVSHEIGTTEDPEFDTFYTKNILLNKEHQLQKYVRIAGKAKRSTDQVLLQLLEMHLDNILFRLSMAVTTPQARQLVKQKHVLVNGRIVAIPSYRCKLEDIITAKEEQIFRTLIQNSLKSAPNEKLSTHLTLHPSQYKGLVNQIIDSKWVGLKIKELLVVE
ncbi:hypothetical protein RYX36_020329 [Vicia faba]